MKKIAPQLGSEIESDWSLRRPSLKDLKGVKDIVVIGDTHCGSKAALLDPGFTDKDGMGFKPSPNQQQLWDWWEEFWAWTKKRLAGRPYIVVHNGDQVDGVHHGCVQLVTNNVQTQRRMFVDLMAPKLADPQCKGFFCIAGTAAHAGQSNADEETCAKQLGAIPNDTGTYARQDLWLEMGDELIQFAHHIGTTSSQAYKSSPAMRLMASMYGAAGEWGFKPPTIMIRSHAHDYVEVKRPNCRVVVCPAWQLKTDWMHGKDTSSLPIIGGLVIRQGEEGVHIREFIRTPKPSSHVKLT